MGLKIQKKIKINSKLKIGLMALLCCAILVLVIKIYQEATTHKVIQEEQLLYEYMCQPKADYTVHIHENPVYEGTVQQEGIDYSKRLLDYIEVKFGTEFQGSEKAEVEFVYQITAEVIGFKSVADGRIVNWSKLYPLIDEQKVIISEPYYAEEKIVKFNLEEYDAFSVKAKEVTGMELSSELLVHMDGNLNIKTEYGNLTSPLNAEITLPLLQEVFSINKAEIPSISDRITRITELPVPINQNNIVLFSMLIVFCIISNLAILLTTEAPNAYDILNAKTKKLVKNYGSRMIMLHSKTEKEYLQTYELNSIEDLIKVSDEIQKPIYYLHDDVDIIGDYMLHVEDGDNIYIYRID